MHRSPTSYWISLAFVSGLAGLETSVKCFASNLFLDEKINVNFLVEMLLNTPHAFSWLFFFVYFLKKLNQRRRCTFRSHLPRYSTDTDELISFLLHSIRGRAEAAIFFTPSLILLTEVLIKVQVKTKYGYICAVLSFCVFPASQLPWECFVPLVSCGFDAAVKHTALSFGEISS